MRTSSAMLALIVAALAAGCGAIVGSDTLVSEDHELEPFDRLEVSHAFDVEVAFGEAPGITITADDNVIEHVEVQVIDGALRLGVKKSAMIRRATLQASITISEPIAELRAKGASTVSVEGVLATPALEIFAAGASEVHIHAEVDALGIHASGASNVTASGRAASATLEASGASQLALGELRLAAAKATLSGASKGDVEVSDALDAALSGASSLTYGGNPPRIKPTLSGASKLQPR